MGNNSLAVSQTTDSLVWLLEMVFAGKGLMFVWLNLLRIESKVSKTG